MAKLKVFTTPIGFHDAYVAAPSRAAALCAWGSERDLFARGLAHEVTDPALTRDPLAQPGTVIRRSRGSAAEQFAALSEAEGPARSKRRHGDAPAPAAPPPPRPSRNALDQAKAALESAVARHRQEDEAAQARVAEAQRQQRDLRRRNAREAKDLQTALDDARDRYDRAMHRWRADIGA